MKLSFLMIIAMPAFFFGCSGPTTKKTADIKTEVKTVAISDTSRVAESVKEEVNATLKVADKYFVIGGCFRYKDNADRLCNKLHKEGYANAFIMPYGKDLYLVAYDGYTKRTEAVADMRKLHRIPDDEEKCDAWLYSIK